MALQAFEISLELIRSLEQPLATLDRRDPTWRSNFAGPPRRFP